MDLKNNSREESQKWYTSNKMNFTICANEISNLIEKILNQKGIIFHSITSRVKEENSFLEKCNKEKYINPVSEIKDVVGIRIITHTSIEVKQVCEVIKNEFNIDGNNSVNKADRLDEDKVGYLSVHYVASLNENRKNLPEYNSIKKLCFEIQVRTLLQHTWAEIEHDKSYKFSGELRKDLKRRFYLVAGVLELMDHEFEKLSYEIENYALEVKDKTEYGDYDIDIDSTSLEEYMKSKYGDLGERAGNHIKGDMIEELKKFGINTLRDIENISKGKSLRIEDNSYYGILRDLMIITDADKYFKEAYDHSWSFMEMDSLKEYEVYNIDISSYLEAFNIDII
jgi:putative GTP pyrophosphokinase